MVLTSILDILRFAVEREEDAIRAYGDLAQSAVDPVVRTLLLELQVEEKNHKRLLLNVIEGKAEALEIPKVEDLMLSDYLIAEPLDAASNIQEYLIFAAKKEALAAELYTRQRDATSDPELRRLFAFLIQQEMAHKLKLETEYEKQVLQED
jgi:rubrerythrin